MILIVDTNCSDREALKRLLHHLGYRVECVAPDDAINYLTTVCTRLVILDITDPEGAGLDILRAIRQDPRFFSTPVVARTAGSNSDAELAAEHLGVDAFLPDGDGDFIGLLSRVTQVCEPVLPAAPEMRVG